MAINNRKYLLNSDGRVFIREKSNCCPIPYEFYNCMRLDGLQKSFGEPTSQFCPSPDKVGEFIEVATIEAAETRMTTSLVGRIPISYDSILYDMAQKGCEFDVQVHFGICSDLSDFAEFESAIVLENVSVTTYSTDQLGALTPDENALVNETVALSVGNWYSIRHLKFTDIGSRGPMADTASRSYLTSLTCSPEGCIGCCDDECLIFVLVGNHALNQQEMWVSKDVGNTWVGPTVIPGSAFLVGFTHEISSNTTTLYCDGEDIYITSTLSGPQGIIWRASKSDLLNNIANFTIVFQNNALLPGTTGYVSLTKFKDRWFAIRQRTLAAAEAATVRVLNLNLDGSNTFTNVYDPNIHGPSDRPDRSEWGLINYNDEVLLVGVESVFNGTNQAYFAYSYDGFTWEEVLMTYNGQPVIAQRTRPLPLGKNRWLITATAGDNVTGRLFCTLDAGKNFSLVNPNINASSLVKAFNNNIAYAIRGNTLRTKFYRTYDMGVNFKLMPEDGIVTQLPDAGSSTGNADINFCKDDPNFVIIGAPNNAPGQIYRPGILWKLN